MCKTDIEKELKAQGLEKKYGYAGVYCIKIDSKIVYIGKSKNMLNRVADHIYCIYYDEKNKYKVLREAKNTNHFISFDVLYQCPCSTFCVTDDIGRAEGEFIRQYMPPLNMQIPSSTNWHKYRNNRKALTITLKEILGS